MKSPLVISLVLSVLETPPAVAQSGADFPNERAERTRGLTQEKKVHRLDPATTTASIRLRRGRCHVVVVELDAAWKTSVSTVRIETPETVWVAGPIGEGFVVDLECQRADRIAKLEVRDAGLGGTAIVRVFARAAGRGEVAAQERQRREAEATNVDADERRKREHCSECRRRYFSDQSGFETCAAQFYDRHACY